MTSPLTALLKNYCIHHSIPDHKIKLKLQLQLQIQLLVLTSLKSGMFKHQLLLLFQYDYWHIRMTCSSSPLGHAVFYLCLASACAYVFTSTKKTNSFDVRNVYEKMPFTLACRWRQLICDDNALNTRLYMFNRSVDCIITLWTWCKRSLKQTGIVPRCWHFFLSNLFVFQHIHILLVFIHTHSIGFYIK